jgi:hypothetical protein
MILLIVLERASATTKLYSVRLNSTRVPDKIIWPLRS